jgi:uroporphyrinogen-III synthase
VAAFFGRLRALDLDARVFGPAQIAAIGKPTADALRERHVVPDLVPTGEISSEGLVDELTERCRGRRVLLLRAQQAREYLREQLATIAQVDAVTVYEQWPVIDAADPVLDRVRRGDVHVVTLTSPNIAQAFLAACDETIRQRFRDRSTLLMGNSQRLVEWLIREGFPALASPAPTVDGLIAGLKSIASEQLVSRNRPQS